MQQVKVGRNPVSTTIFQDPPPAFLLYPFQLLSAEDSLYIPTPYLFTLSLSAAFSWGFPLYNHFIPLVGSLEENPLAVMLLNNRLYMSRKGPEVGMGMLDFVEVDV